MMNKKHKLILALCIAVILVSGFAAYRTYANPIIYPPSAYPTCGLTGSISSASTSPCYMTPGTATTSIIFDSYQNTQGSNTARNTFGTKSAALMFQLYGSSTASIINLAVERSQNGVDYYADSYAFVATSTGVFNLSNSNLNSYVLTFASSTLKGEAIVGDETTMTRIIRIETPTRFTRVVFTSASSTILGPKNTAIWGEMVPIRETN